MQLIFIIMSSNYDVLNTNKNNKLPKQFSITKSHSNMTVYGVWLQIDVGDFD